MTSHFSDQNDIDKEDQWLGVTVKSQGPGGFVMVCAHRYVHRGTSFRWGNGICYSLTQFLDYNRSFDPCLNRNVQKAHEEFGLFILNYIEQAMLDAFFF